MDLTPEQIAYKSKVGQIGNAPVFEVITKGGWNMVIAARDGRFEPIGAGPHRAVARHIAMKREPKIEFTEIKKSDHLYVEEYAWMLPEWEQRTDELRTAGGF